MLSCPKLTLTLKPGGKGVVRWSLTKLHFWGLTNMLLSRGPVWAEPLFCSSTIWEKGSFPMEITVFKGPSQKQTQSARIWLVDFPDAQYCPLAAADTHPQEHITCMHRPCTHISIILLVYVHLQHVSHKGSHRDSLVFLWDNSGCFFYISLPFVYIHILCVEYP